MKITKYEHSFMVLDHDQQQLVIDPGTYTPSLPELNAVTAVIVTHEHADHLSAHNLAQILSANPGALLYAPQDVLDQLSEIESPKVIAQAGETVTMGAFKVAFIGGRHATIYKASPCENVGVMVDDEFYYPGDSLDEPNTKVKVLAVPAHAPWMKTSETMNFIDNVSPDVVFPAHNMLLSDIGEMVTYRWLKQAADNGNSLWRVARNLARSNNVEAKQ